MAVEKPCMTPEARQFDFWLGEWEVRWSEDGVGTNHIEAILDGCVIQETFDGRPGAPLQGMSVSVYNVAQQQWQQTWVDNQGGYLDFVGEFHDGRMVLARDAVVEGKLVQQRMVWFNIRQDELDWHWERSEDGGQTWRVLWHIRYRRK